MQTYAINDKRSFQSLTRWHQDIQNFAKNDVVLTVVGNKCDLQGERAVSKEEGQQFADAIKATFYQTSAKEDIGVEEPFKSIASTIYSHLITTRSKPKSKTKKGGDNTEKIVLEKDQVTGRGKKCC